MFRWEAPAQSTNTLDVPDDWTAGRVWGRRNCDFSKPQAQDCAIGACIGGLQCTQPVCRPFLDRESMIYCRIQGVPPVTLAEFSLLQANGNDFYDVSIVDGYGLPVRITPSASACHVAECAVDLGPICPAALVGPLDSNGFPLGCKSACLADLDGDPSA